MIAASSMPSSPTHPPSLYRSLALFAWWTLGACSLRAADPAEAARLVEILALGPGQTVADVGAGEGDFVPALAEAVGESGRVIATEVEQDLVDEIRDLAATKGLPQVSVHLGDQEGSGLPPSCCDAILLRLVYHHFTQPAVMREDLERALTPGGLIAIVDITPQEDWRELPGVPDRGGHGVPTDDLVDEMIGSGFEWVESIPNWNGDADRFALLFRRSKNS